MTTTYNRVHTQEIIEFAVYISPLWLVLSIALSVGTLYLYSKKIDSYMQLSLSDPVGLGNDYREEQQLHKTQAITSSLDDTIRAIRSRSKRKRNILLLISLGYLFFLHNLIATVQDDDWPIIAVGIYSLPLCYLLSKKHRYALFVGLILVLIMGWLFARQIHKTPELRSGPDDFLFLLLFALCFYWAFSHRKIRRLTPLFSIALTLTLFGIAALVYISHLPSCSVYEMQENECLSLFILTGSLAVTVVVFYLTIAVVGYAYSSRCVSEEQLGVLTWIIISGLSTFIFLDLNFNGDDIVIAEQGSLILPGMLIAIGVYTLLSRSSPIYSYPHSLLYLRVFRHENDRTNFFSRLSSRWNYIGPIQMIAGPDLAKSEVEPDEISLFIRGKLHKMFISERSEIHHRLSRKEEIGTDGKYRVNEYFCYEHIWRSIADILIRRSHYIIADFRGFTAARIGAGRELDMLADSKRIKKTLFVVSDQDEVNQLRTNIKRHRMLDIGVDQFMTVERRTQADQVLEKILKLGAESKKNDLKKTTPDVEDRSMPDREVDAMLFHKNLVEQHRRKNYGFSLLTAAVAVICLFLSPLTQFIFPFYLLTRGVSWRRVATVFATVWCLFWAEILVNVYLGVIDLESKTTADSFSIDPRINVLFSGLYAIIWLFICFKVNRWKAAEQEPLKHAIKIIGDRLPDKISE